MGKPLLRQFPVVAADDPEYNSKMEARCTAVKQALLSDYPLAFATKIIAGQFVEAPPVSIHVNPKATPVQHTVARPYPVVRDQDCKQLLQQLLEADIIERFDAPSQWSSHASPRQEGA